jgi:hypothetical protein
VTEADPTEPPARAPSAVTVDPPALRVLRRFTRWRTPPPRWRGLILLLAGAIFVVGIVLSFRGLDLTAADVVWWPIAVLAIVGTPLTILLYAAELRAMARCLDDRAGLSWARSVRVVVIATAANILPLPGGALVRVQALSSGGAGLAKATAINLIAAVLWLGAAIALAGGAALAHVPLVGTLALVGGGLAIVVGIAAVRPVAARWAPSSVAVLLGVEVATTLLHAAKLLLALVALGIAAGLSDALVLGVAGPLSAAAGIFPSGLGLAELLSALLAPVVALSAAAGFGATALVRLVGLVSTAPLALFLGVRDVSTGVDGSAADAHGSSPHHHGSAADAHGSAPDTHGSAPDAHGSAPDSDPSS